MSTLSSEALRGKTSNIRKFKNNDEKAKEDEEREERINYTLDMVVHDLVSQGRMCDQLSRRKKEEQVKTAKTRNVPKSYSSYKTSSKVSGNISQTATTKPNPSPKKSSGETGQPLDSSDIKKKLSSSKSSHLPAASQNQSQNQNQIRQDNRGKENKKSEHWSPRDIADEKLTAKGQVFKDEHSTAAKDAKPVPFATTSKLSQRNMASAEAYRAKIDMSGFANDEISLDLDDRRLIITASRPKKGQQNARKVTEYLDIPEGVNLENLKIGRRLDGSLLIEEFIPGVD